MTAYQNKLEDTSNEVTLALFGSLCIAFGLQRCVCFACKKGQKSGNVDLTASCIPKEIISVMTVSLSFPCSEVSCVFWGTGSSVFFFLVSFFVV